jgi:hypothetical protein
MLRRMSESPTTPLADITATTGLHPHPNRARNLALRAVIAGAAAAPIALIVANLAYRNLPRAYLYAAIGFGMAFLAAFNLPPTVRYGRARPGDSPSDRGVWGAFLSFIALPIVTWPAFNGRTWMAVTAGIAVALAALYARRYPVNLAFGVMAAGTVMSVPLWLWFDSVLRATPP